MFVSVRRGRGLGVGARGFFLFAKFLVELGEVIADVAVLRELPACAEQGLGVLEIAAGEINPAERVPIGCRYFGLRLDRLR